MDVKEPLRKKFFILSGSHVLSCVCFVIVSVVCASNLNGNVVENSTKELTNFLPLAATIESVFYICICSLSELAPNVICSGYLCFVMCVCVCVCGGENSFTSFLLLTIQNLVCCLVLSSIEMKHP